MQYLHQNNVLHGDLTCGQCLFSVAAAFMLWHSRRVWNPEHKAQGELLGHDSRSPCCRARKKRKRKEGRSSPCCRASPCAGNVLLVGVRHDSPHDKRSFSAKVGARFFVFSMRRASSSSLQLCVAARCAAVPCAAACC